MNPSAFPNDCLRPAFTEKALGWLQRGKAVNIFGDEGKGIGRLAEDLALGCPPEARFVRLSMKSFAYSYADFLQALADALGIDKAPDADIRLLLNNFLASNNRQLWLCLEHFDRLADKEVDNKPVDDKGYDIHFLNYLNSLHNDPRVSLLVCSRREIRAQELYIGGKTVSGSRLEFSERVALPDLTFAEIEAYLYRSMPDSVQKTTLFKKKPAFFTTLITEIDAHSESAYFADFVAGQAIDPAWDLNSFQERLRFWKKEYTRLHAPTFDRRLGRFEKGSRHLMDRTGRMLGITKMWRSIGLKMKLAIAALASIALGGLKWGEQVWIFISNLFHK